MASCEVAIVGGGPAGLQCALLLARARRRVIVFDRGDPRNGTVREAHGFFSRDGIAPTELLEIGRAQLATYENATIIPEAIDDARSDEDRFLLVAGSGRQYEAKRVVLATGMRDKLPEIEGLAACWGLSVFVCPYCDGWEVRDRPLAVWGNTRSGIGLAQELYQWSRDLFVCADVATPIAPDERRWLEQTDIKLKQDAIRRLRHRQGMLNAVEFDDGTIVEREALFMSVGLTQCCDLAATLGCALTERGHIDVDVEYRTSVPGIYAAGDAVTHMHQIVFAAASGARAAIAINNELTGIA